MLLDLRQSSKQHSTASLFFYRYFTAKNRSLRFQIVNPGDQNGTTTGQVINQVLPVATKIETPKKRPIEATYNVAPAARTIEVASAQTLNRSGGLNSSMLSQASNGNGSFHDLNGPAAKRARLARGGLRICAKVGLLFFYFYNPTIRMYAIKSSKKDARRISR